MKNFPLLLGLVAPFFFSGCGGESSAPVDDVNASTEVEAPPAPVVETEDEEEDASPTTEAEEDEELKKQSKEGNERRQKLLDEVNGRTFANWTEKDWKALDKAYLKSL